MRDGAHSETGDAAQAAGASGSGAGSRRAALAFIVVSIVLDVMAGSLVGPVAPRLVRSLSGLDIAGVSQVFGAFITVFFFMQMFAGPVQGALSDRFGRRPVLIASTFGLALDYVIMALAPNVAWLFVGRVISGAMAGGFAAAYAYIADVTAPEERARYFGAAVAAASVGMALGPILGGYLAEVNLRAPFWLAGGLGVLGGVYGLLALPESLPVDRRSPLKLSQMHPLGAIASVWRELPALRMWGLAFVLLNLGLTGVMSIFALYTTYRFGWRPKDIGLYAGLIAIETIVVQAFAVGPVVRWLGDRGALLLGLGIQTLAMLLAGAASTGLLFLLAVALMIAGGFAGPAQTAILNGLVGPADRGRLSGATRSLLSIASVGAPALFSLLFAASGRDPKSLAAGAPFYVATLLMILAAIAVVSATAPAKGGERAGEGPGQA
jgi:MFS transporter, DHA1 family, tetracycline resistance protein